MSILDLIGLVSLVRQKAAQLKANGDWLPIRWSIRKGGYRFVLEGKLRAEKVG